MNKENIIIGAIGLGFLVIFGALIYFHQNSSGTQPTAGRSVDTATIVRNTSHMTASPTAKVTLVEFGDYQCPACGQAEPVVEQLLAAYKDNPDFNFVFRNFPLPQHQNAMITAEAAEAAGAQGKFWEMHNMIYEKQAEWSESTDALTLLKQYAATLGLDVARFTNDLNAHTYASVVKADQTDGNAVAIDHTPTFFLNGVELPTYDFNSMKAAIDADLAK